MHRALLAAGVLAALSGCAAPYFSAQYGRVTPKGAVRATLGTGYNVATSAKDVVDDAKELVSRGVRRVGCTRPDGGQGECFRQEDLAPIVDAAFRFALASPFASHAEVSLRYGLADRLDAGLHLAPSARRIDLGFQAFGPTEARTPGWAGSVFLGVADRDTGPVGDVLSLLRGEASIVDADALLVAGRQWRDLAHAYVGARYLVSRWKLRVSADLPILHADGEVRTGALGTDERGVVHQAGAIVGGALGWRRVFVGAEVATTWYRGSARVFFRDRLLEGVAVMPSVYVTATY